MDSRLFSEVKDDSEEEAGGDDMVRGIPSEPIVKVEWEVVRPKLEVL